MNKILITGGSGFIGTNLVEFYRSRGENVLNLDIARPRREDHVEIWEQTDLLNEEEVRDTIKRFNPDLIFHLAARTDLNSQNLSGYLANTEGTQNILKAVRNLSNLKRLVFTSTRLVCKTEYQPKDEADYFPTTAYGQSKIICERLFRETTELPCPWVIGRPTSIWGPWFDVPYLNFFHAIKKGLYFHPRKKRIKKSYGFVGNTVFQLHKLAFCPEELINKKTIYLADYPPLEVREWAEDIRKALNSTHIKEVPIFLLKSSAIIGDLVKYFGVTNPPITSFRLNNLVTEMVYNLEPIKSICGELPFTTEQGVNLTVDWMRTHLRI